MFFHTIAPQGAVPLEERPMIAICEPVRTPTPASTTRSVDPPVDFVSLLPQIRKQAQYRFSWLGAEAREDAVAETVARAFVSYHRLIEQGKADKIAVTGKRLDQKIYYRHSQYPGGLKQITLRKTLEGKFPERALIHAVRGMVMHNRLGADIMSHLKAYAGPMSKAIDEHLDVFVVVAAMRLTIT